MGTGNAQTFYYKVKYGPIVFEDRKDYKYIVLFKVESCWDIEDGREAVKNWCTKNIKDYNKFDGSRYTNSIIYELHKDYYENFSNDKYDAINKEVKFVELNGTYVKPKEIDYKYNPTEDQMKLTNNFFENIDNVVPLWNTPPDNVSYRIDANTSDANTSDATIANKTTTGVYKVKWNTTGVNEMKHNIGDECIKTNTKTSEYAINTDTKIIHAAELDKMITNKINEPGVVFVPYTLADTVYTINESTITPNMIYNSYGGTTFCDNKNTSSPYTFTSNNNPPEYSKDNKEYENLMLI